MDKDKRQFLRFLYFQDFQLRERELKLTGIHDFNCDADQIRNDQSISEVRQTHKLLDEIIEEFFERF